MYEGQKEDTNLIVDDAPLEAASSGDGGARPNASVLHRLPQSLFSLLKPEKRSRLHYRHEQKYFMNEMDAFLLTQRLLLTMDSDKNSDENGEYHIRSLYLDDAFDTAFYTKLMGIEERKKYRIRIYNLSDKTIKLECKQKSGQYIHKRSVDISRKTAEEIIDGNPSSLINYGEPLANEVYFAMRSNLLRPVVIVDYMRRAFVGKYQDVRITLDRDLRTAYRAKDIFDKDLPTVRPENDFATILEVKFGGHLPEYYGALLRGINAERSAASKYVMCRRFEY